MTQESRFGTTAERRFVVGHDVGTMMYEYTTVRASSLTYSDRLSHALDHITWPRRTSFYPDRLNLVETYVLRTGEEDEIIEK
jgi:hypothetical protein